MINFLKIHWFGLIASILAFLYLMVFLLVLISPRQDRLNRGFTPCTKQMVSKMFSCSENKAWCMAKAVVQNGWCDTKVVGEGFAKWMSGEQTSPWANYLYVPELEEDENLKDNEPQEGLSAYYQENSDIEAQMKYLEAQRLELDSQLNMMNQGADIPQKQNTEMEKLSNEHPQQAK